MMIVARESLVNENIRFQVVFMNHFARIKH